MIALLINSFILFISSFFLLLFSSLFSFVCEAQAGCAVCESMPGYPVVSAELFLQGNGFPKHVQMTNILFDSAVVPQGMMSSRSAFKVS